MRATRTRLSKIYSEQNKTNDPVCDENQSIVRSNGVERVFRRTGVWINKSWLAENERIFEGFEEKNEFATAGILEIAQDKLARRLHSRKFCWTLSRQARLGSALPG